MNRLLLTIALSLALLCGCHTAGDPATSKDLTIEPGAGGVLTSDITSTGEWMSHWRYGNKDYSLTDGTGSPVTVAFLPDDTVPADTDLSGIQVVVYELVGDVQQEGDFTGYNFSDVFLTDTDRNGVAQFHRPTEICSLEVRTESLPDGIGLKSAIHTLQAEDSEASYGLTAIQSARISADHHLDNVQVELLDGSGAPVRGIYRFVPTYTRRAAEPDLVEVSGVVQSGELAFPVSTTVDFSDYEEFDKLFALEQVNLLTRQEQEILDQTR